MTDSEDGSTCVASEVTDASMLRTTAVSTGWQDSSSVVSYRGRLSRLVVR